MGAALVPRTIALEWTPEAVPRCSECACPRFFVPQQAPSSKIGGVNRVFVYGSLKAGFRHHDEIAGAKGLGEAATALGYYLVIFGEYPALVVGGTERVYGELYEVSESLLLRLDQFEDVPTLYQRTSVVLSDRTRAVAYTMAASAVSGCSRVASGRWSE